MRYFFTGLLFIFLFSGCSSKNPKTAELAKQNVEQKMVEDDFLEEFDEELEVEKEYDPLKGYNRFMTRVNENLYEYAFKPVIKGYEYLVVKELRVGISNFFHNILYPVRFVNNILQGKFENALDETGRFVINSTVGFFGMSDQAKDVFNLHPHNEDFGQTLGYWGVGSGFHIVLPILGPSNLRDLVGFYPDSLINPVSYVEKRGYNLTNSNKQSLYFRGFEKLNEFSLNYKRFDKIKEDAIDLYPFLKDLYEQRREKLIKE